MTDLYERPDRGKIAARVQASLPGATTDKRAAQPDQELAAIRDELDPVRNFTMHLSARMRALGWDQKVLEERTGVSAMTAARAINGTGVQLELAAKIAAVVSVNLVRMISPYVCGTCAGQPPAGFGCLECGAEGART